MALVLDCTRLVGYDGGGDDRVEFGGRGGTGGVAGGYGGLGGGASAPVRALVHGWLTAGLEVIAFFFLLLGLWSGAILSSSPCVASVCVCCPFPDPRRCRCLTRSCSTHDL